MQVRNGCFGLRRHSKVPDLATELSFADMGVTIEKHFVPDAGTNRDDAEVPVPLPRVVVAGAGKIILNVHLCCRPQCAQRAANVVLPAAVRPQDCRRALRDTITHGPGISGDNEVRRLLVKQSGAFGADSFEHVTHDRILPKSRMRQIIRRGHVEHRRDVA